MKQCDLNYIQDASACLIVKGRGILKCIYKCIDDINYELFKSLIVAIYILNKIKKETTATKQRDGHVSC